MKKQPLGGNMKISSTMMNYQQLAMTQNSKSKTEQVTANGTSTVSEPELESLRAAQAQLNNMAEIDTDRIAEIKVALKDGRINLDPEKIAQAMLKYHQG